MGTIIKNGVAITHLRPQSGAGSNHPYLSIERLRKYLYRVTFDALLNDSGNNAPVMGACSAYVKDGKLHRNFDFKYDNAASFIIRTNDFEGLSMITGLNDGRLEDAKIAQLPYRMVDGRNNNGIMVSVHLLFNDWQYTGAGDKSIPLTRLPFEVLTRVKSMETIATDLTDVLSDLVVTEAMGDYLLQCLITDGTTTYALIPPTTEGASYVLVDATAYPKMSNFRYVARAEVVRTDGDIQTRPTGIERFNMMPCPLEDLRFTKCYEAATRLSEFIGIDGTDKDSTDEELTAIYNLARAEYLQRKRDGKTWQTMHSVVYGDKMEELYIQENWEDNIIVSGGGTVGGGGLEQYPSLADFPKTGNVAISYLARDTKGLYYWDEATQTYITMANKIYPVPGPDTANDVYIKYTDGTISPYNTLVAGKTPVGPTLINNEENVKIVLHPNEGNATFQSPNGLIPGTFNSDSKNNTDLILAQRELYSVAAAVFAREGCIYADGSEGQLPSMDVMEMILANADKFNIALELIGGTPVSRSKPYHSSNQSSSDKLWVWDSYGQSWVSNNKSSSDKVRSVCAY